LKQLLPTSLLRGSMLRRGPRLLPQKQLFPPSLSGNGRLWWSDKLLPQGLMFPQQRKCL
jgi:hypothetical protein